MVEKIIHLDQELLIFLNGLGSEKFDFIWLFLTKQLNWLPFFIVLLYLVYKKTTLKIMLLLVVFIALMITVTNEFTDFIKFTFQRQRPCSNPEISAIIRIVKSSDTFSFFSGHAANSSAAACFLYLFFKKHYKYAWSIFFWPLVFAYSRIYLGLHFPIDILTGYLVGVTSGFVFYLLFKKVEARYFFKITTKHD